MSKVRVFKFFWADQDVAQEQWLRAMAKQGLHLKSLNPLCVWTFDKGEPADMAYRVDFPSTNDKHFDQLLEDAGWEKAAVLLGWHYWRKSVEAGVEPEIFTDSATKTQKFKNVLAALCLSMMPITVMLLTTNKGKLHEQVSQVTYWSVAVFLAIAMPILLIAAARLVRRIWADGQKT
jgi:hypothetical protein